jgi:hypothetical protein
MLKSVTEQLKTHYRTMLLTWINRSRMTMKYSYFADLHAFKVSWNNHHHETGFYSEENCYSSLFYHNNWCCMILSRDQFSAINIKQAKPYNNHSSYYFHINTQETGTARQKAIVYSGVGYAYFQSVLLRFCTPHWRWRLFIVDKKGYILNVGHILYIYLAPIFVRHFFF